MRTVTFPLLVVIGLGGLNTARAADLDYDYLRGAEYEPAPTRAIDWSGAYLGGHGGYTSAALGYKGTLQSLIYSVSHDTTGEANLGASTLLNPRPRRVGDTSFGGFAGYNFQFDQIVFGFEADYTNFGVAGVSGDALGRSKTTNNILETVDLNGASSTRINDYGTLRARVGYAFDNLMPFVTGGFAIGRARVADTATYHDYGFDVSAYNANLAGTKTYITNFGYSNFDPNSPSTGTPATDNLRRTKTKVVAGATGGVGLEYAITPNIILRGEYQYVLFNDFDGHKVNLNTVRGGAAVKF